MRRTRFQALGLAATLALTLPACDGLDNGIELDSDLVGEWILVEDAVVNTANTDQEVDLLPMTGVFLAVTLNGDGTVAGSEYDPGSGWNPISGTWSAAEGRLTLDTDGEPESMPYHISGGRLIVELNDPTPYDFDGDGQPETTEETFTFASAEDSPDGAFQGTWGANGFVFISDEEASTAYDVIDNGGSFTITLSAASAFDYTLEIPDGQGGLDVEEASGEYVAIDGLLWLLEGTEPPFFAHYTLNASLAVVTRDDEEFDFDGDGVDDPARLVITMNKQ